jgi:hypothetical protein
MGIKVKYNRSFTINQRVEKYKLDHEGSLSPPKYVGVT